MAVRTLSSSSATITRGCGGAVDMLTLLESRLRRNGRCGLQHWSDGIEIRSMEGLWGFDAAPIRAPAVSKTS